MQSKHLNGMKLLLLCFMIFSFQKAQNPSNQDDLSPEDLLLLEQLEQGELDLLSLEIDQHLPSNPVDYILQLLPSTDLDANGDPEFIRAYYELILNPPIGPEETVNLLRIVLASMDHHMEKGVGIVAYTAGNRNKVEGERTRIYRDPALWNGNGEKHVQTRVQFEFPFLCAVPKVLTGVTLFDAKGREPGRAHVYATDVDNSGFTINFDSYGSAYIYSIEAEWMALC